jgi:hypothetical protein
VYQNKNKKRKEVNMNSAIVRSIIDSGEAGRLQQRLSYVAGTARVEYIGISLPGIADDVVGFQIRKLIYDGNNITDINYADDNSNFDFIWDNRAAYFV